MMSFSEMEATAARTFDGMGYRTVEGSPLNSGGISAVSHKRGDTKPLDTITRLAEDAERSAEGIKAFIARFTGNGFASEGCTEQPDFAGHYGQIERLKLALNDIDMLVRELGSIG